MNVAILVSGRGSNMAALLQAHSKGDLAVNPAVVFSNKPEAPALATARDFGIPVESIHHKTFSSRQDYDRAVIDCLSRYDVQGAVLAGYMRIVTPVFLDAFPKGVVNIHPSLLPSFRGVDGVQQAWDYGAKVVGCTVHFVNAEVDDGPIIVQKSIDVMPDETAAALGSRLLDIEHKAIVEGVNLWGEGRLSIVGRRVVVGSG